MRRYINSNFSREGQTRGKDEAQEKVKIACVAVSTKFVWGRNKVAFVQKSLDITLAKPGEGLSLNFWALDLDVCHMTHLLPVFRISLRILACGIALFYVTCLKCDSY
jgi:hypothetical protein